MLKKIFMNLNEWLEDCLRGLLGRITPDLRVILIVMMFLLFSGLSIYISVSSIYNYGKRKGEQLRIERIKTLQPEQGRRDSINPQNNYKYERTNE